MRKTSTSSFSLLKKLIIQRWHQIPIFPKALSLCCIGIIFLFLISIFVYPEWGGNYRRIISLFGLVILAVFTLVAAYVAIVNPINDEYKGLQNAKRSFKQKTRDAERILQPKLKGIPNTIARDETRLVLDQVNNGFPVLLTGDAGTGKSGIAIALVTEGSKLGLLPLLLDARRLSHLRDLNDFRSYFDINQPIFDVFEAIGKYEGMLLILDQFDNIAGTHSAQLIMEFVTSASRMEGISVVVASRRKEANEKQALDYLLREGYQEIRCGELREEEILEIYHSLGITVVNENILQMSSNLLNLDLICETIKITGIKDVSQIQDEITLWEKYRRAVIEKENLIAHDNGNAMIDKAIDLAREGLATVDRSFKLEFPPNAIQERLVSSGIITQISGRLYQYSHEKLQDYLYAWDACEQLLLPRTVHEQVNDLHIRNIFVWMTEIYSQGKAPVYRQFLEEILE